jgi:L-lactate utilization protein LutC
MSHDKILHKVRTALGRSAGQEPAAAPEPRLRVPAVDAEARIAGFREKLEALAGRTHRAASPGEAAACVAAILNGRPALASNAPFLSECGVTALEGVRSGVTERDELRQLCATVGVGVTSADYALADTGSLVLLSSAREARMISLLPPAHVAVIPAAALLTGLDELLSMLPRPAEQTSSMVLITGPSRTADIEQILVRGVHGPGEVHAVIVG